MRGGGCGTPSLRLGASGSAREASGCAWGAPAGVWSARDALESACEHLGSVGSAGQSLSERPGRLWVRRRAPKDSLGAPGAVSERLGAPADVWGAPEASPRRPQRPP